jgi:nucleotidyltransferase-like protein
MTTHIQQWPALGTMVEDLVRALGGRLVSVVLYGSAARGEHQEGTSDLNLVVVAADLEPRDLEALAGPIASWTRKGQPPPRLMTPALLADAVDAFPIEFLDIRTHHVVLHGSDPFAAIRVQVEPLRLQCEREFREKLMRLREGYVAAHRSQKDLKALLTTSYTTFAALFRAGLHLVGATPPAASAEAAAAFCARAGLDAAPFAAVDALRRGDAAPSLDLRTLFSQYYEQLARAVGVLDAFRPAGGGETR